jgi:hypothetical protein
MIPQAYAVLYHIREYGSITNDEAHLLLGVRSLSRRITDLRRNGYKIHRRFEKDSAGRRYVRYFLYE